MDVDSDKFYDDIGSYMPQPELCGLEDLNDILRSTDSHLDASLDISEFSNSFIHNDYDMTTADLNVLEDDTSFHKILSPQQQQFSMESEIQTNFEKDYLFNFSAFPSPAASQQSAGYISPFETPIRTSSPISTADDFFNPDDFINFSNEGDIKSDDCQTNAIIKLNENCRSTPSPTGSCSSSSGSSTSGVQSDASSVASMSQNYKDAIGEGRNDSLSEFIKFKNEKLDQDLTIGNSCEQECEQEFENAHVTAKAEEIVLPMTSVTMPILPIAIPSLPITTISTAQPIKFVQGTIIPVQPVPMTTVDPVVNIKAPAPIKIENQTGLNKTNMKDPSKLLITPTKSVEDVSSNVIPPVTSKPKTIYLSSNDFKALMQKMNTNGKQITGANGQIPKIIMKTANGKIITANKIGDIPPSNTTAQTVTNSQSLKFASKLNRTSGGVLVKQQPSKVVATNVRSAAVMAAARGTPSLTKSNRPDFSVLKGLNDDKLLKKQLRMLKNRESASLSRKKKKEYVEKLENRISNLEKENYSLRGQNSSLRSQLMAFAQTCNCKHGNVSEFILNTLNMDGKNDEEVFNAIDASHLMNTAKHHLENCGTNKNHLSDETRSTKHHVKIAPKPANSALFINKGNKYRMNAATVKKNVAVLFAMAFMVTLNVGNFQNYLNKSALENAIETSAAGFNEEPLAQSGRRLLWVPNEHEFNEQRNRTKRETDITNMPPPPLHFLRPANRTTADKVNGTSAKEEPPIKKSSHSTARITETYANTTKENMRLARDLHKWIDGNDFLNLTGAGNGNDFEQMEHFKFGSGSYMNYDSHLQAPIGTNRKRKLVIDPQTQEKHAKLNIKGDQNSLDIFKPRISEEYIKLFKGIKRQEDTFYVLSFNMDHILLPASAYNKSSRPRMSLMLPAGDPSHNGDIVLMQIDCDVINTTELEIKSHMIPKKLRPTKYSANVRVNSNEVANNGTASSGSVAATKSKELPLNREELKGKPSAPRTYFMGPRNQSPQSANSITHNPNIMKSKPTVVKLHANDSVIGSGILNVPNSSLFSRMRHIVGSQTATDGKKLV